MQGTVIRLSTDFSVFPIAFLFAKQVTFDIVKAGLEGKQ